MAHGIDTVNHHQVLMNQTHINKADQYLDQTGGE